MKVYYKPIRHKDFEANMLNPEITEYDTDKYDKALILTFSVKYKNGPLQNDPIFADVTLNKDNSIEVYVKQKDKDTNGNDEFLYVHRRVFHSDRVKILFDIFQENLITNLLIYVLEEANLREKLYPDAAMNGH
jgi:hypothetical protein|nr:MAG TPA: hypothetical protein [Caudoviricetes sp.]